MSGIHNLKPEGVIRAFERAGWKVRGQKGSHVKLDEGRQPEHPFHSLSQRGHREARLAAGPDRKGGHDGRRNSEALQIDQYQ